jgi:hypothetical protein
LSPLAHSLPALVTLPTSQLAKKYCTFPLSPILLVLSDLQTTPSSSGNFVATMNHRADASNTLDNRGYTGPLIRDVNPVTLLDTPLRDRITDSLYWREPCFGLNAATLLDRATELSYIGDTYGISMKFTPFICLVFKLLALTPENPIMMEYLEREEGAVEISAGAGGHVCEVNGVMMPSISNVGHRG